MEQSLEAHGSEARVVSSSKGALSKFLSSHIPEVESQG